MNNITTLFSIWSPKINLRKWSSMQEKEIQFKWRYVSCSPLLWQWQWCSSPSHDCKWPTTPYHHPAKHKNETHTNYHSAYFIDQQWIMTITQRILLWTHTIWKIFVPSPLNLNMIAWSQIIQTVRYMKVMRRSVHRWCSQSVPLHSFLNISSPLPVWGVPIEQKILKHYAQFDIK